jgi:release factor glutamine methyltransferase
MTQDFAALGIATPRLDAELLLCHALGCDRVRLYMDMQRPLQSEELASVRALVVRRRAREPVAYIVGKKAFYQHELEINHDVLVPRPDTEVLVDRALEALPQTAAHALDLCTGSGAIAIAIALERAALEIDATDLSDAALAVAARNVAHHGLNERIRLHRGDLFAALPERKQYALIVANPPYVGEREWSSLAPEVTEHEPKLALLAGEDGLDVLKRLCREVCEWLAPGGTLIFEVGRGQAQVVSGLLGDAKRLEGITTHRDLAGIERVVEAKRASD